MTLQAPDALDPRTKLFFRHAMTRLDEAGVPFLVGGAYAFARYTGIERHTKDFDLFVRPEDVEPGLAALAGSGYRTELVFSHWLGKAYCGDDFVDLIYSSGNGLSPVDDDWFANAVEDEVIGMPVRLIPAEEMIWQKAFVMERERFDGADVLHILRASAERMDWARLLRRFGPHWRVLLGHLILFGFVYPLERTTIPREVMAVLIDRLQLETTEPGAGEPLCRGTLLSRAQYLIDVEQWGYRDARLLPSVQMTPADVADWTAAIARDGPDALARAAGGA